jgi:hypothetical protein
MRQGSSGFSSVTMGYGRNDIGDDARNAAFEGTRRGGSNTFYSRVEAVQVETASRVGRQRMRTQPPRDAVFAFTSVGCGNCFDGRVFEAGLAPTSRFCVPALWIGAPGARCRSRVLPAASAGRPDGRELWNNQDGHIACRSIYGLSPGNAPVAPLAPDEWAELRGLPIQQYGPQNARAVDCRPARRRRGLSGAALATMLSLNGLSSRAEPSAALSG